MAEPTWELVEGFLRDLGQGTQRKRARAMERAPLAAIREAAIGHPDASLRRWMLGFLDHYDNDASMATFAAALHDPDEHVRTAALHSIACDACKTDELCVADVVRSLIDVLLHDPLADLRIRSLQQLTYLATRDDRVLPAIKVSARSDADRLSGTRLARHWPGASSCPPSGMTAPGSGMPGREHAASWSRLGRWRCRCAGSTPDRGPSGSGRTG